MYTGSIHEFMHQFKKEEEEPLGIKILSHWAAADRTSNNRGNLKINLSGNSEFN